MTAEGSILSLRSCFLPFMVAVTAPPPLVPSMTVWASLRCTSSCIWLACESICCILSGIEGIERVGHGGSVEDRSGLLVSSRRSTTEQISALKMDWAWRTRGWLRASAFDCCQAWQRREDCCRRFRLAVSALGSKRS